MEKELDVNEMIYWVTKVSTEFYELCYQDPWFKKFFRNIKQEIITSQQTDFMVQAMGGPKQFCGRNPKDAHPQVWVDEYIWEYREQLLIESFQNVGAPEALLEKWLKIDEAFKKAIINTGGKEELRGRYKTEELIYEPMPEYIKARMKKKKAS